MSEVGEPSTVSQPLSCPSSSDMLETGEGGVRIRFGPRVRPPTHRRVHLLGLLHGDREGLDWTDLEVRELVLRLLSGLLREHTLTMETAVLRHTSHTHSFLHLLTKTQDSWT